MLKLYRLQSGSIVIHRWVTDEPWSQKIIVKFCVSVDWLRLLLTMILSNSHNLNKPNILKSLGTISVQTY